MSTTHARTLATLAASVALMVFVAGCAGPSSTASPWAAEFEALRTKVEPDSLAARIIADDQITEAEIREVQDAYVSCLADRGIPATINTLGGHAMYDIPADVNGEETAALLEPCKTPLALGDIQGLYNEISINPQHIDRNEAIAQCLIDKKVVDPSTTGAQYKAAEEWEMIATFGDPNDPDDEGDTPSEYGMLLHKLPLTASFEEAIRAWEVCSMNAVHY